MQVWRGSVVAVLYLALVGLEEGLDRRQIVVRSDEGRRGGAVRDAGRVGQAERRDARPRRHEERVGVPVVAPVELDHLLAVRVGAHQAEDAHARLGAGVGEADHLDGGHRVDHHLRQLVLQDAGRAERRALLHRLRDRIEDGIIGVAEDGGAPGADVVDVLVAIDVVGLAALDAVEDHRLAADRLERTHRRGDAARHDLASLGHDLLRVGGREGSGRGHLRLHLRSRKGAAVQRVAKGKSGDSGVKHGDQTML